MAEPVVSSRRAFLQQGLGHGVVGLVVLAGVAGCGKTRFTCTDTAGLIDPDKQLRATLAYTDTAADPNKQCQACAQWVAAPQGGCGSCKILKGPIHAEGTCNVFARKS